MKQTKKIAEASRNASVKSSDFSYIAYLDGVGEIRYENHVLHDYRVHDELHDEIHDVPHDFHYEAVLVTPD